MYERAIKCLNRYKEIILYGVFGVGATLINIICFYFLRSIFSWKLIFANIFAWLLAFIFAFFTNKIWVFESRDWNGKMALKECVGFFFARFATLIIDIFLMYFLVTQVLINDIWAKIWTNAIVIILNYLMSKFMVFKNYR